MYFSGFFLCIIVNRYIYLQKWDFTAHNFWCLKVFFFHLTTYNKVFLSKYLSKNTFYWLKSISSYGVAITSLSSPDCGKVIHAVGSAHPQDRVVLPSPWVPSLPVLAAEGCKLVIWRNTGYLGFEKINEASVSNEATNTLIFALSSWSATRWRLRIKILFSINYSVRQSNSRACMRRNTDFIYVSSSYCCEALFEYFFIIFKFFSQNSYDKIIYTFLSRKKKGMSVMFLKMWGKIKSTEEHGAKKKMFRCI